MSETEFQKAPNQAESELSEAQQKFARRLSRVLAAARTPASGLDASDLIGTTISADLDDDFVVIEAKVDAITGHVELILQQPTKTQKVLLIGRDENVRPTAYLIERRLRNLRQVYASLFIAYAMHEKKGAFSAKDVAKSKDDLELLIPEENHLVVVEAGVGSFWIGLKTAGKTVLDTAKRAPKARFLHDLSPLHLYPREGYENA